MKRFGLLSVALTMIFLATDVLADLITSKAVLKNDGSEFSSEPVPFRENSQFEDDILVLDQPIQDIAPGQYPLFKVITHPFLKLNFMGGNI